MQRTVMAALTAALLGGAVWLVVQDRADGPRATPPVGAAAADVGPALRAPAALPSPVTPAAEQVGHPDASLTARRQRIEGFGKAAVLSAAVEAELIAALADPDQDTRGHAAWALGRMAPKTHAAIPALTRVLGDNVWAVAHNATWALLRFEAAQVEAPLLAALRGPTPGRAIHAGRTLLKIDAKYGRAVEPVVRSAYAASRGPDRVAAIETLSLLPTIEAATLQLLRDEIEREASTFRGDAIAAIAYLGPKAAAAAPTLLTALGARDARLRVEAAAALGRVGDRSPQVVRALVALLDDPKERASLAAADALSRLEQLDALEAATRSGSQRVRANAIAGLLSHDQLAGRRLDAVLACAADPAWEVRLQVAGALSHPRVALTPAIRKALSLLAKDAASPVADQAKAGLRRLAAAL